VEDLKKAVKTKNQIFWFFVFGYWGISQSFINLWRAIARSDVSTTSFDNSLIPLLNFFTHCLFSYTIFTQYPEKFLKRQ